MTNDKGHMAPFAGKFPPRKWWDSHASNTGLSKRSGQGGEHISNNLWCALYIIPIVFMGVVNQQISLPDCGALQSNPIDLIVSYSSMGEIKPTKINKGAHCSDGSGRYPVGPRFL